LATGTDNLIESYQQSITVHQEIGDRSGEAKALGSLGRAFNSLRQHQQAIAQYQQQLTIFREIENHREAAEALRNIGNAYHSLGEYQQAIEHYQQSKAIAQELGDRQEEANCLNNIGEIYNSQGQYQPAIDSSQQGLVIFREIDDKAGIASSLGNLGNAYYFLGQCQKAIEYHQMSLTIFQEMGDKAGIAKSLTNLGSAYSFLEEHQTAIEYYQQGLVMFQEIGDRAKEAGSLYNLGMAYQSLSQYQQALEPYQQSEAIFRDIGDKTSVAKSLDQLGYYQQAIEVQESIQGNLKLEELKTSFADRHIPVYERLVGLLCREGHWEEAFNYVERSRARAFLDQFANGPINFRTGVSAKLLQQEETIKAQIAALRTQLTQLLTQERQIAALRTQLVKLRSHPSNQSNTEAIATLQKQLLTLEKDYTNLLTELKLQSPEAASLVSVDVASLYGTQPLISDAATESAVFSQAEDAEILHLSVHGEFNKHNPLFSTLYLAADDRHDGRLEVHDIYALDLTKATNLVALSACQTQLGELSRGDEIVGLNRAFLYAGTPSVIATLWSVQDDSTALLMERFYTHLRSGIAKAQALRQAQIEVRAEYPHPYYWAAFVLTGDGGSGS
jgi:tetratricopeptide (TPR) repeat protein